MNILVYVKSFTLNDWYDISQILLLFVAITAGIAAWRQLQFNTYFELTKFLQDPTVREYRHRAYDLLETKSQEEWTLEDRLAVSGVFSSFDVVGMLAKKSLVNMNFFAEFYHDAIVDIRRGHAPYLKAQRDKKSANYWGFMELLYREASAYKDGTKASSLYNKTLFDKIKSKIR